MTATHPPETPATTRVVHNRVYALGSHGYRVTEHCVPQVEPPVLLAAAPDVAHRFRARRLAAAAHDMCRLGCSSGSLAAIGTSGPAAGRGWMETRHQLVTRLSGQSAAAITVSAVPARVADASWWYAAVGVEYFTVVHQDGSVVSYSAAGSVLHRLEPFRRRLWQDVLTAEGGVVRAAVLAADEDAPPTVWMLTAAGWLWNCPLPEDALDVVCQRSVFPQTPQAQRCLRVAEAQNDVNEAADALAMFATADNALCVVFRSGAVVRVHCAPDDAAPGHWQMQRLAPLPEPVTQVAVSADTTVMAGWSVHTRHLFAYDLGSGGRVTACCSVPRPPSSIRALPRTESIAWVGILPSTLDPGVGVVAHLVHAPHTAEPPSVTLIDVHTGEAVPIDLRLDAAPTDVLVSATESDGLSVGCIGTARHWIHIRALQPCQTRWQTPGNLTPAAVLYEAFAAAPTAPDSVDEAVGPISLLPDLWRDGSLLDAARQCIECAFHEASGHLNSQRIWLRAARSALCYAGWQGMASAAATVPGPRLRLQRLAEAWKSTAQWLRLRNQLLQCVEMDVSAAQWQAPGVPRRVATRLVQYAAAGWVTSPSRHRTKVATDASNDACRADDDSPSTSSATVETLLALAAQLLHLSGDMPASALRWHWAAECVRRLPSTTAGDEEHPDTDTDLSARSWLWWDGPFPESDVSIDTAPPPYASVASVALHGGRPRLAVALAQADPNVEAATTVLLHAPDTEAHWWALQRLLSDDTADTQLMLTVLDRLLFDHIELPRLATALEPHAAVQDLLLCSLAQRREWQVFALLCAALRRAIPDYCARRLRALASSASSSCSGGYAALRQVPGISPLDALATRKLPRWRQRAWQQQQQQQQQQCASASTTRTVAAASHRLGHATAAQLFLTLLPEQLRREGRVHGGLAEQLAAEVSMQPRLTQRLQLQVTCAEASAWASRTDDPDAVTGALRALTAMLQPVSTGGVSSATASSDTRPSLRWTWPGGQTARSPTAATADTVRVEPLIGYEAYIEACLEVAGVARAAAVQVAARRAAEQVALQLRDARRRDAVLEKCRTRFPGR